MHIFFCFVLVDPDIGLSGHSSSSSPENSDDFVVVPKNLPIDQGVVNYERKYVIYCKNLYTCKVIQILNRFRI